VPYGNASQATLSARATRSQVAADCAIEQYTFGVVEIQAAIETGPASPPAPP
jgi:hypothetical protein